MRRSFSIVAAVGLLAVLQTSLQAHDSVIPHVHPHGESSYSTVGITSAVVAVVVASLTVYLLLKGIQSITGR
ncbi:MAG: hypothetical protein AAFX06_30425 [Planctomycetota bacterium]